MFINEIIISVETISRMGVGGIKKSGGGCEFNYGIFDTLYELL
jgi:hypothetical protein